MAKLRPWLGALAIGLLLAGAQPASAATVTRGPYLQMATSSSIVIRWRTDEATDSMVRYGDAPGNLGFTASAPALTTEHEVRLTGLPPGTRHYYSVGSSGQALSGGDASHFFATAPSPGVATFKRNPTPPEVTDDAAINA